MNYLRVMKDILKFDEQQYKPAADDLIYVDNFLNKNNIEIPQALAGPFYNHIIALVYRLKEGKAVDIKVDEVMRNEISNNTKMLADTIMATLFNKYHQSYNEAEVILIAMYLQSSI